MHGESAEEDVPRLAARFIREELGMTRVPAPTVYET